MGNHRPVENNLTTLGKLLESVLALQLQGFLANTDYRDPFQSGFRTGVRMVTMHANCLG